VQRLLTEKKAVVRHRSIWALPRVSAGHSPGRGCCQAEGAVLPGHLVPGATGDCLGPYLHPTDPTEPPLAKANSGCEGKLSRKLI